MNYNINHHSRADNRHLYISLSPADTHTSVSTINNCLTDVLIEKSKGKLNVDNNELIHI